MDLKHVIAHFEQKRDELETVLADPTIISDQKRLEQTNRQFNQILHILELGRAVDALDRQYASTQKALEDSDPDVRELAQAELQTLEEQRPKLMETFELALLPKDPLDEKDAIVEIRAGAGGDEAALFAADLFRMYSRFAEETGRKIELISESHNDIGGFKEVIFEMRRDESYGHMRYESGVHRVQRVPETEKQGRVHTSTATVAVLPKIEQQAFHLNPNDLEIITTTAQGAGGQHVNKTESAIRMTHKPTGIQVYCQSERSQHQNKDKAMEVMRSRVFAYEQEQKQKALSQERKNQIGSGDRSEKIRTYNAPQDRVTDHRLKESWHNLPGILDGNIWPIINKLKLADRNLEKALQ